MIRTQLLNILRIKQQHTSVEVRLIQVYKVH